jgi:hypothetical protein
MSSHRSTPNSSAVQWYLPELKRPIAGTPVATKDLIDLLAGDNPTASVTMIRDSIYFDPEARAVLKLYIDAGYGDDPIADLLANRIPRRHAS